MFPRRVVQERDDRNAQGVQILRSFFEHPFWSPEKMLCVDVIMPIVVDDDEVPLRDPRLDTLHPHLFNIPWSLPRRPRRRGRENGGRRSPRRRASSPPKRRSLSPKRRTLLRSMR